MLLMIAKQKNCPNQINGKHVSVFSVWRRNIAHDLYVVVAAANSVRLVSADNLFPAKPLAQIVYASSAAIAGRCSTSWLSETANHRRVVNDKSLQGRIQTRAA